MFMTFLLSLFQSNLYVVSARGKDPKNSIHRDLFRTKNHKQKTFLWDWCLKGWIEKGQECYMKMLKWFVRSYVALLNRMLFVD